MKHYILLRKLKGDPVAVDYEQLSGLLKMFIDANGPGWIIRYAYYAFIASLPFEAADIGVDRSVASLSKIFGYTFMMVTLLQPHLCFKSPPKAFWCFAIHLCIVALMGVMQEPLFYSEIITQIFTQTQLLVLFWISYNLIQYEGIGKGTLGALAVSCFVLAVLQVLGVTSATSSGRVSAFGTNPNAIAGVLSIGLLALVGFAYGQKNIDIKVRRLAWLSFGVVAAAIILTGSRGAMIALVVGLMAFLLQGRSLATKLKAGLIVLVCISSLVWASYQIEAIRLRWESTFYQGDVAGRERIFKAGWELFQEQPLIGWGPVSCWYELGARLGQPNGIHTISIFGS